MTKYGNINSELERIRKVLGIDKDTFKKKSVILKIMLKNIWDYGYYYGMRETYENCTRLLKLKKGGEI